MKTVYAIMQEVTVRGDVSYRLAAIHALRYMADDECFKFNQMSQIDGVKYVVQAWQMR